jgi:hypothetical protein
MQYFYTYLSIGLFSLFSFAFGYQVGHKDGYEAGKRAGMFRARQDLMNK